MNKAKISVSVDDGHPMDLRVAEILLKKSIPAIFYIPIKNRGGLKRLRDKEIKYLSSHFEIGGHTYNHADLTSLSEEEAQKEIVDAKIELEGIITKKIVSFAPPYGKFNNEILRIIKSAGFNDVRSARTLNFREADRKNFLWHPNLHLYPHTLTKDIRDSIFCGDLYSASKILKNWKLKHLDLLPILAKSLPKIHIWLHSWEIDKFGLWKMLENL
ncbi:MAG: Polysaccharide deacetylase [Candidatus Woesebacteria bacterium GW2011_GWC2_47_16]|uniref:Polysaccharide deacetylase n=8 Tax=Candidatus Woeseibacteriota TaxID=1752722 RepID=A0A0G1T571_9BACT|nr:MAG: Polysaccharide deacetylase [Candidatus Woesebacteria bacterium GW2011_GWE1_45_18]KKU25150.1 MAG: Polysaccharide deacetylase [Candidatus Woesebacteria bacterium GW2011_GWF1_46_13]KKU49328.1 MAG: Polysaccharide deacetylase [Candidatus Woesebacteria bacterium GW2011_GWF2_46_8]KKU65377.1 MAG: Polysaccharide deacetylase [Candidatus Woesebacteria bacterium GW2011_GWC2_47_16]KKU71196.1 MAG: Polysaccharide deacetylase [Candidatus Woesebacteria bacterium GW2011_GWD1_47_21]OGM84402.1 MAG: hypoth